MFAAGSRYEKVQDDLYVDPKTGRQIHYRRLRVIPSGIPVQSKYLVAPNDRFDLVSYAVYGDPLQFWRICDANGGMWPDGLLATPGRQLDIPEKQ